MTELFHMELTGEGAEVFVHIVNQGIDARLEAITGSKFKWMNHILGSEPRAVNRQILENEVCIATKLHCDIHPDDYQVILRRLWEMYDSEESRHLEEHAYSLEDALLFYWYALSEGESDES